MASGTISLGTSGKMTGRITWSSESNGTAANSSKVTAKIQVSRTNNYTTLGTFRGTLNIGGTSKSFSWYGEVGYNWVTLYSFTVTKTHNSDGSGTCYIYGKITGPTETSLEGKVVSNSKTVTLDKIPRQATITAAPNFNDEDNPTISYSNPAGSAVDSLQACISLDGSTDDIAYRDISKTGTSYTFNLTDEERAVLYNATTTSNSREVRFYVQTVIDGVTYRSYLAKTLTIVNAAPTVTGTAEDTDSKTLALTGNKNRFIKYHSNAKVAMVANGVKGATITSRKITNGNKTSVAALFTIPDIETGKFVFTATDSRGNTTTKTVTKSIVPYIKITANLSNAKFTTDGVITFDVKGNYYNSSFGAEVNALTLEYRYKTSGGEYGEWIAATPTITNHTYAANITIEGLDYQSNYVVQARAKDKLETATTSEKTLSCIPVFDWGESDFNFNVPVTMNYKGNSYNLLGLLYSMTTTYELPVTVTPGDNYTEVTATAHLVGTNLRIGISAKRNGAVSVGNITNEIVATLLIDHGGKLNNLYRVDFNSGTEGGTASFDAQASIVDDNTVKVTIYLCGTTTAATGYNGYFAMPCTIITKAYV